MGKIIAGFNAEFAFLDPTYPCPVSLRGVEYPSVEAALLASRTDDHLLREHLQRTLRPSELHVLAKRIPASPEWTETRLLTMRTFQRQKFDLARFGIALLATGDASLRYTNTWGDVFWGLVGRAGENQLGIMLMSIRDELQRAILAEPPGTWRAERRR